MATEEGVPLANQVADAFLEQYYHVMGVMPQEANKFYVDSSVVSRPGSDGTMMSFTSVEAIKKEFLSSEYENTTYEVVTVDSHKSVEDGIFIMVIGLFTGKDNLKRKFSQMFYLGLQENAYVVFNDIFRFVDENASAPITLPVTESVPPTETAKPAGELNKTEPIHKIDVNAVEKSVNAAGATPPLDNGKKKHSDEKVVTAINLKEPVAETAAPQSDGAKKSYASIVQSMAKSPAPFQAKAPVQAKYMAQPRAATSPRAPAAVSKSEKKVYQKIVEEPGTSIFVANLPMTAMPPQLHELFQDFGPIKENGIQVRSNRAKEVCFGFVAFESATSVQSVLQAAKKDPFMLADRKLRVKEKEVDYDGGKPSGKTGGVSKAQNGSAAADGSKAQNGSADGGDDFVPAERKHRSRNRKNVGRTERNNNQKSSEGGGAPVVQQA